MATNHPALDRILHDDERRAAFDLLSAQLSGSDLTTVLLGLAAERAERRTASDVVKQYRQDRFVVRSPVDALDLCRVELAALEAAGSGGFEPIALAPLAPFGVHHVVGQTPQNNVVTTSRQTEVAADPTVVLAVEAAVRRSSEPVHLAATQRVTRAQHFEGPRSFAHFLIFGMLSAGRDRGDYRFEIDAMSHQIKVAIAAVRRVTDAPIRIRLTPFNPDIEASCQRLVHALSANDVDCDLWPEREHGRGYYQNLGFKLDVRLDDDVFEVGDGGDVYWTQQLMQDRKQRTVIGGLGLERLAMVAG